MQRWLTYFLVMAACGLAIFWRLGSAPIHRSMEGREALVIQEMVRSGDWVLPLRNREDVPHKPPLMHWIGAIIATLRGGTVDETGTRLPSALASAISLVLLFALVRREHGERRALASVLVLLTTESFTRQARNGWVDPVLSACVLAAVAAFLAMDRRGRWTGPAAIGFYVALGLGVLAKGPIGVVLPALGIAAYLLATHRPRVLRELLRPTGIAVFCAVAIPWYVAALAEGGMAFFSTQIIDENLKRFFVSPEAHHPPYFFLRSFLHTGAPWSLVLPFALWHALRARGRPGLETFALWWWLADLVFLSVAAGKRAVYILPTMPAVAILVSGWFARLPHWRSWRRSLTLAAAAAASALACALLLWTAGASLGWWPGRALLQRALPPGELRGLALLGGALHSHLPLALASGLAMGAGVAVLVVAAGSGNPQMLQAALLFLLLPYVTFLKPLRWEAYKRSRSLKPFALRVKAATAGAPLAYFGTGELPQVFFYLDRHVPRARCARTSAHLGSCPPGYYLLFAHRWRRMSRSAARDEQLVMRSRDFAPLHGRGELVLVAVGRNYAAAHSGRRRPQPRPAKVP